MEGIERELQGKHAHTANMLLRQLKTKEITLEEFLMQCAYWGVKTMGDIYFRSLPSRPMAVVEYESLSYSKRNRLTKEYYEDNPGVMRYYEDKDRVLRSDRDDLLRLKQYKKYIPESDTKTHEKLDKMILDFKMKMEG
jgi:hypothetical protein